MFFSCRSGSPLFGARIVWPPRRKFDPDEADFSNLSDTAQARPGVKVYRGRPGFLVHCRSGWLGLRHSEPSMQTTKEKGALARWSRAPRRSIGLIRKIGFIRIKLPSRWPEEMRTPRVASPSGSASQKNPSPATRLCNTRRNSAPFQPGRQASANHQQSVWPVEAVVLRCGKPLEYHLL
jgi:hypothetical protein